MREDGGVWSFGKAESGRWRAFFPCFRDAAEESSHFSNEIGEWRVECFGRNEENRVELGLRAYLSKGGLESSTRPISADVATDGSFGSDADSARTRKGPKGAKRPSGLSSFSVDLLECLFAESVAHDLALRSQLMATAQAAALQHVPTVGRAHAHAEAVSRASVAVVRLISSLHGPKNPF